MMTSHQTYKRLWDDPKANNKRTIEEKLSIQVIYGAWWEDESRTQNDLGQRPKENSNEDSEGFPLGLYTTTGCTTWG